MSSRSPRIGTFLIPLLALAVTFPTVAQNPPKTTPTAEAQKAPLTPEERRAKARERAVSKIWWNQNKKLEKVDLSAETRKKMDALLLDFLERRSEMMDRRQVDDFAAALEKGDFAAAQKAAEAQTALNSEAIQAQMNLMIEVARLMTPAQRKAVAESFPMLFRRDWIPQRGMMGRGPGERGGQQRRGG